MRSITLASFLPGILVLATCAEGGGQGSKCGNHVCDLGEDQYTCATDCPASVCGDAVCQASESAVTCLTDCYCGNATCDVGESRSSCPQDCSSTAICGNGACEAGETAVSCPADCSTGPVCGNGVCEAGESSTTCPADCSAGPACGNGVCEAGESSTTCPADCPAGPVCGNGVCEAGESSATCPADCPAGCDDPTCDVLPQCGCSAGDKCTITTGSTHACVDAGSGSAGDACAAETECATGTMCVGAVAGHAMCMEFCATTSDCPGGAGASCVYTLNDGNGGTVPGVKLCSVDCSPVTPATSCPAGWNCDIYVDESDNLLTDCTYTGSTNTSGACTASADCAPGYLCDTLYGTCARWCRVGSSDCGGLTCYSVEATIGSVTYGVCDV